ncbi:hypothetical protein PM082_022981 [Marasmius tenuissimus]|nr:hypothetical protein PM082_022981 [Marasmius tenuissimus]
MAPLPKPCKHCEHCDNFESESDDSDADRSQVACKNCERKRNDHHAPTGVSKTRKPRSTARAIVDALLDGKDGDEAEQLLENANKEAKAGLKSKKKQKSKSNKNVNSDDEKKKPSAKVFRLGLLFMDIHGTLKTTIGSSQKALKLKSSALPSRQEIVEAIQRGHAARFPSGLDIPEDATFDRIDHLIRKHLPKPFEHFDQTWEQSYSPFVFACNDKRKLSLCQHLLEPTGQDIRDISRSTAGRGFENNCLYIVTRKAIPEEVVASWSPSTISDVEDSDDRESHSDRLPTESEGEGSQAKSKPKVASKRYRRQRVLDSDAEASEGSFFDGKDTSDGSTTVLRPRKKARLDAVDLTQDIDSDEFEMSMAEFHKTVHGSGSSFENAHAGPSSLFLPGTPPSQSAPSTSLVNPQYSDPRPKNDPYTNKPNLDFLLSCCALSPLPQGFLSTLSSSSPSPVQYVANIPPDPYLLQRYISESLHFLGRLLKPQLTKLFYYFTV